MSQLNKKYLISGCGLSYSGQERRTWVNILRATGVKITDVGGPAVSNQWIINKVILELYRNHYDSVIIQLTSLGKLDVEVDEERIDELVSKDPIRNFTFQGVWPSSVSDHHESKQLYNQWLRSPHLEMEDLVCKLLLLKHLCDSTKTNLYVFQGYNISWTDLHRSSLSEIIKNIDTNLYDDYPNSAHYQFHDHSNTVPCLSYQYVLAKAISNICCPEAIDKINKMLAKSNNIVLT